MKDKKLPVAAFVPSLNEHFVAAKATQGGKQLRFKSVAMHGHRQGGLDRETHRQTSDLIEKVIDKTHGHREKVIDKSDVIDRLYFLK